MLSKLYCPYLVRKTIQSKLAFDYICINNKVLKLFGQVCVCFMPFIIPRIVSSAWALSSGWILNKLILQIGCPSYHLTS